ncbi:MAG: hypothetical protein M3Z13_01035, partial [Candidatus Dormibacteraeota bacterium]|nr:hypothetical protein [Candidatus Dormibacteraeota bacterium]
AALPDLPAVADVYRYAEPVGAQRSELARNLGSMSGLSVLVLPSRPDAGLPPTFSAEAPGSPADGRQATAEAAAALLRQHSLMPSYTVRPISGEGSVTFARELALGRGKVLLVDGHGGPIGLRVTFGAGSARISGPVDLPLTRASYPLRSMAEAIASVVSQGGTGGGALDRVDLVYVVAGAGGQGYLEPALFFSGPAVSVLVPAVADDHLTP